jgi:hypothetical protein
MGEGGPDAGDALSNDQSDGAKREAEAQEGEEAAGLATVRLRFFVLHPCGP